MDDTKLMVNHALVIDRICREKIEILMVEPLSFLEMLEKQLFGKLSGSGLMEPSKRNRP